MSLENYVPVKIKGYEENYLVNKNTCEVYSKIVKRVLKGCVQGGYMKFNITNSQGEIKAIGLHRIMIETFKNDRSDFKYTDKENPSEIKKENLVPNHIDGNKLNNKIENIEWCTRAYNNKEAYRLGLRVVSEKTREQFKRDCVNSESIKRGIENLKCSKRKAIENSKLTNSHKIKVTKDGKEYIFSSCTEAAKFLGLNKTSVCRALKSYKTYKGRQNLIIEPLEK